MAIDGNVPEIIARNWEEIMSVNSSVLHANDVIPQPFPVNWHRNDRTLNFVGNEAMMRDPRAERIITSELISCTQYGLCAL